MRVKIGIEMNQSVATVMFAPKYQNESLPISIIRSFKGPSNVHYTVEEKAGNFKAGRKRAPASARRSRARCGHLALWPLAAHLEGPWRARLVICVDRIRCIAGAPT